MSNLHFSDIDSFRFSQTMEQAFALIEEKDCQLYMSIIQKKKEKQLLGARLFEERSLQV